MKNQFLYTAFIIGLLIIVSCGRQSVITDKNISYYYIYNDNWDKAADSIKLYNDLPFEKSLELYTDTDSLTQQVQSFIYLKIFKTDNQKFAIMADSAFTHLYKFMPDGHYKKQISIVQQLGMEAKTAIKDLNHDGYKDVIYTMVSGGSYGDDNSLLFYDPKQKTFTYNEEPLLRNIEIAGDTVNSYTKFLYCKYIIKGYKLELIEDTEFLQQENDNKKVTRHYSSKGKEVSRDTILINQE